MKIKRIINIILVITLMFSIGTLSVSAALLGDSQGFYYQLLNDNTAILKEYHGENTEIVIPDKKDSYNVTGIAESAFSNNTKILSVVIPGAITVIGEYAFYGCSSLERVEVSASVSRIETATFYGCINLKEVYLPSSIVEIAPNAFAGCSDLVIKGEKDTVAEMFAEDNDIPFVDVHSVSIIGDVDNNNVVDSADSLIVLRMSVGLEEIQEETRIFADVDEDDKITSADSLYILRHSVGFKDIDRIGQSI